MRAGEGGRIVSRHLRRLLGSAALAAGIGLPVLATPATETVTVVDDFETPQGWGAFPADGVDLALRSDTGSHGRALRLDFRFRGGGGYAVARKAIAVDLPENYAFTFRIRGRAPVNHLEFKLVDASGENVWWSVRRNVAWPRNWETWKIKKRQIQFAWGPLGGGEIRHVAAVEFVVTAGSGGAGSVWIDDFELRPLPPPEAAPRPILTFASSARTLPELAVDGDSTTAWQSTEADPSPTLTLDFQAEREFGGLLLDWLPGVPPLDYVIESSDDRLTWHPLRTVSGGNGGRDFLQLPEAEARAVRVRVLRAPAGARIGLREIVVEPLAWGATREAFFGAIASSVPRGFYPRGIGGEQPFWTVVGADADRREALLSEDGALETGKGQFSIEPFLYHSGRLWTWAESQITQSRPDGSLPAPGVLSRAGPLELRVTAFATGSPGASAIVGRYVVTNRAPAPVRGTLYLALRPFQVNPPAQFLNTPGGTAPITDLALDGRAVRANGKQDVFALQEPDGFGAVPFDGGDIAADFLRFDRLPAAKHVRDEFGAASGALAFGIDLGPGGRREVDLFVPLYSRVAPPRSANDAAGQAWVEAAYEYALGSWRATLRRTRIDVPDSNVTATLETQLGCILVNRAGSAIQPGTRAYARSWIRDGALTSSALLRLGHADAVRDFILWFAPYQYPNGKVPCVVDERGADPTPEHDSNGEFIDLVTEYYRYTGDRALAERLWPQVQAAVGYLDSLRHLLRTAEYRSPEKRVFFGLLPPSISHEGYAAKPMHSYWDDLWALRGFQDAAFLAGVVGRPGDATRIRAMHDEFATDLAASVRAAIERHRIDYVPGCADLGDFDATSTTIALEPVQAGEVLPEAALRRTFEKYWEFFRARAAGSSWEAYTPYELRNVGAFVRLGWRDRAVLALDFFLGAQKPPGWRQWPEVVWREERVPHFIGDLPHTWVGSDYIRSVLDMLAYEREDDQALVLGAGVPRSWLGAGGVRVRDLATSSGPLTFTMREVEGRVEIRIEPGLRVPAGGIVLLPPGARAPAAATVSEPGLETNPRGERVVRSLPASVCLPLD